MQLMMLEEFRQAIKAQGVPVEHTAFICPLCGKIQSGADFMRILKTDFDSIQKYLAFSCVGRFTGAGPPPTQKRLDHPGCNWTLGGLFQLHQLEVVTPDGEKHPRFELATPAQAQSHMKEA